MNFEEFGLAEPILRSVLKEGYTIATPIQIAAIPPILDGRDVVGCAQTGTGKTAAFALPIIHGLLETKAPQKGARRTRVLVLASTRELALQISDSFETYGANTNLRVVSVFGGVSQNPQCRALRQGVDILVATPGRLLDLIEQGYVNLKQIQTLVLDEADRMLDMGFLPAIQQVLQFVPAERQTLLFSATMPPAIRNLVDSILRDPLRINIEQEHKATELVEQSVYFVSQPRKTACLIDMLQRFNPFRSIVFSRTKHGADRIVKQLEKAGIRADAIHSNKSQNKRQGILNDFKRNRLAVLVATDIAARGIDVDGVSHIFNFDIPNEPETYVHRIGRSGRAGATGIAISLCDGGERRYLRDIERLINKKVPVATWEGGDSIGESDKAESRSDRGDGRRSEGYGGRPEGRRPEGRTEGRRPEGSFRRGPGNFNGRPSSGGSSDGGSGGSGGSRSRFRGKPSPRPPRSSDKRSGFGSRRPGSDDAPRSDKQAGSSRFAKKTFRGKPRRSPEQAAST